MSLGQSRIEIIAPLLLAVIPFLYGVLKPGRSNCAVVKELSRFVSVIASQSVRSKLEALSKFVCKQVATCLHTNFDKASSWFLTELMLIYDTQTFFGCFSQESLNWFLSFQY